MFSTSPRWSAASPRSAPRRCWWKWCRIRASEDQAAAMRNWRKYTGSVLGVLEAYLSVRGIRTLSLRMARQCANAAAVARTLASDGRIERVYFPGLPDSADHPVAARLFPEGLFGAVLAFAIHDADRSAVMRFLERLKLIRRSE